MFCYTIDGVMYGIRCSAWNIPTARKEHFCDWSECPRRDEVISRGETYLQRGGPGWGSGWKFHLGCAYPYLCSKPAVQLPFHTACGPGCIEVVPRVSVFETDNKDEFVTKAVEGRLIRAHRDVARLMAAQAAAKVELLEAVAAARTEGLSLSSMAAALDVTKPRIQQLVRQADASRREDPVAASVPPR